MGEEALSAKPPYLNASSPQAVHGEKDSTRTSCPCWMFSGLNPNLNDLGSVC
jgi:hypothetical protein